MYFSCIMEISISLFVGIGDEVLAGIVIIFVLIYILYQVLQQLLPDDPQASDVNEDLSSGRIRANAQDCSICLGEAAYAIETNCGHVFCSQCIMSYYDTVRSSNVSTLLRPFETPTCPYCRQRMTVLLIYFSDSERNAAELDEIERRNQIIASIRAYNRRYSGEPRSVMEHIRDLPVLLRHLWSFIWSADGLSWLFRLRIFTLGAMAALYILSPFDIVPEAAFGLIGILDDLVIIGLFLLYASILYRNFIVQDQQQ